VVERLVDLNRYPVTRPDSSAYRDLIASPLERQSGLELEDSLL